MVKDELMITYNFNEKQISPLHLWATYPEDIWNQLKEILSGDYLGIGHCKNLKVLSHLSKTIIPEKTVSYYLSECLKNKWTWNVNMFFQMIFNIHNHFRN
jgi:hypothetical protein